MWAEAIAKLEGMESSKRERLWPQLVQGFKDLSQRLKVHEVFNQPILLVVLRVEILSFSIFSEFILYSDTFPYVHKRCLVSLFCFNVNYALLISLSLK